MNPTPIFRRWLFALVSVVVFLLSEPSWAAKQKFRGIFGTYRRPKFVENEARSSGFGMNFNLSTLLPVSPIVKTSETEGQLGDKLHFSTFFNVEVEPFYTLGYHWQVFGRVAYMTYETRKETTRGGNIDPTQPIFHQFNLDILPLMGGVRYRFGKRDIVPYVGVAAGIAYIEREASYDNSSLGQTKFLKELVAEVTGGFEFYFAYNAGLRIEVSAFYIKLPEDLYRTGTQPTETPIFNFIANPWTVRYASGIFVLF